MTEDEYKAGEVLPFPSAKSCQKCGRTIDESGLCRCDPDYISPAEQKAKEKLTEVNKILIEIRGFLSHQTNEPSHIIEGKGTVFSCRGCGARWLSGEAENHDPRCWPAHMVSRINTQLAKDGL